MIYNNINKKYIKGMLLVMLLAWCSTSFAQTSTQQWSMVNNDTLFIDACEFSSGTIYDNGGLDRNYFNSFNGWVVITSQPDGSITLGGSYFTEGASYDWIDVWDGYEYTGTLLVNHAGGIGTLTNVTATSGRMTIHFQTNETVVQDGFKLFFSSWGPQVTNLTATPVNGTRALLHWNGTGSGPYHIILNDVEVGTSPTTDFIFDSLDVAQHYSVKVYPEGQENYPCAYDSTVFQMDCNVAPLVEDFNDLAANQMPPCWIKSTNFDDEETQPRLVDGGSGNLALMVSCGSNNTGSHYGLVVSPAIAGDETLWLIDFDYRASHSGTRIVIGVCDSTSAEYQYYGFTALDTLEIMNNTQWAHYRKIMNIPIGKCRLAFRMIQSHQTGVGRIAYIDNLSVENCGINEVWLTQTGFTSVKLNWTVVGTPTVNIGVRLEGSAVDDTVILDAVSPYVVDGLLSGSRYTLTLYPFCDGHNHLPDSVTVQTLPTVGLRTELCESPVDYDSLRVDWNAGGSFYISYNDIQLNDGSHLITPPINDLGGKDVFVTFYSGYDATQIKIVVGTATYADDFSSFTPFDTIDNIQFDKWQNQIVHIPENQTDRFVAFLCLAEANYSVRISNVSVGSCMVRNARITEVHHNNITVAWDAPSGPNDTVLVGYRYYSTYTYDTVVGVTQHTVTGLNANSDITLLVRRPCGGTCNLFELKTHTPRAPQPLCENFDGPISSLFPTIDIYGWYRPSIYNDCPNASTLFRHSPSRSIKMESFNSSGFLVLPYIDSIAGNVLSFWAQSNAPASEVVINSNTYTSTYSSEYHPIDTIALNNDGLWHHYATILPDTLTHRVALRYQLHDGSSGSYLMGLDDLQSGICGYGDFTFANLTSHSFDVVWESIGATAARIQVIRSNTVVIDTIAMPDTVHFTGLDSNKYYSCYIAPILGTDTLCLSYAGQIYTPTYPTIYLPLVKMCNPFDENDLLPNGWIFSDSTAIEVSDGTMTVIPGLTPDIILLPPIQASALYIAARGLSGSDTLFVDGDTTVLDTVWRHYCFEPDPTWGHRVSLRVSTGSSTGGCEMDNVGFSNCPIIDFTTNGNSIDCQVRDVMFPELILTLTDEDGIARNYHITTRNYTIDGLAPLTTYTAEWHCLYLDNGCMPTLDVRTDSLPLPYCIDFSDGNNTSLPGGWKVKGWSSDTSMSYSNDQYQFYSYIYSPHWQYIILPEAMVSNNLTASIYGYMNNSGQQIEIGILTDPADTSTFITAGTFHYQDVNPFVADLSQLPHGHVAIRNMGGSLYISGVQLFDAPQITEKHLYRYDTLTIKTASTGSYGLQYLFTNNTSSFSYPNFRIVNTPSFNLPASSTASFLGIKQTNASGATDCFSDPTYIYVHTAKAIPYCNDFQSTYNDGYFLVYNNQCSPWYRSSSYNSEANTYEYYLSTSVYNTQTMTFPYMLVDSVKTLKVGFKYRYENYSNSSSSDEDLLLAGVLVDALDSSDFVPTDTIVMIQDGEWHTTMVDFSSYPGDGRWIALRDIYNVNSHRLDLTDFHIDVCQAAIRATATLERYNVVRIDNNADELFYVEYGPAGFVRGTGTLQAIDTIPYRLTLTPESEYEFYFYCDSTGSPCAKAQSITTLSQPLTVPLCIDFDTNTVDLKPRYWSNVMGNSIVSNSVSRSDNNSLMVLGTVATPDIDIDSLQEISLGLWVMTTEANTHLMVGTVTNPVDPISFHNLKTIVPEQTGVWEHHFVSFKNAPENAHFIALRNSAGNSQTLFVDDLHLTSCAAFDIQVTHMDNDSIGLTWSRVGTPDITFTVEDNGISTTYTPTGDSINLAITPLHSYNIAMHSECTSELACNVDYNDTIHIIAPAEGVGCINPTDLQSPQSVFFSGTYQNPYDISGAIDCGSRSPDSRHTVCYDTTERDPRTGGLLRTVPEGYTSSVRLGNWSTNRTSPEAEGVVYSLFVDTTSFDLLMMHYAAVLQDPMHDAIDQPRFRLELLDSAYNLVDPVCAAADFIANRNLGWNEAADNVLWKDWTPVGIDVSAYAGQQVFVRLTTYDCNEGAHYGYAYFTLECMRKNINSETCGNVDSNRFTAPAGFNYRWYTSTSPTTISTERSLVVPTASMATYFCDLTFVGNDACSFTLSAYGGPRLPLAQVDTTVSINNCHFDVQFTNLSSVSLDGINPAPTHEQVETAYWDFGNGETSNSYHGHTVYDTAGTYTVTLIVGISGGECTDTLIWPMHIGATTPPYITGPASLCYGDSDTLRLYGGTPYNDSLWADGGDHWYLPIDTSNYQLGSNIYTLIVTDSFGCTPPVSHTLTINPVYQTIDSVRICNPLLPYSYHDTLFLAGTTLGDFDFHYTTTEGCDSNFHLWLSVNDTSGNTFRDTILASICDDQSYAFYGNNYTNAGTYNNVHVNTSGSCDSIHTLQLEVRPTSAGDTLADECDSFTWHGTTYTAAAEVSYHSLNTYNCDSLTTLHLNMRYSSDAIIDQYIVENDLPYLWNNQVFTTDTTNCIITIPNSHNCDSTITFSLTIYRNQDTTLYQSLCENNLPIVWNGVTFNLNEANPTTNIITHQTILPTSQGADSLVTMHLQVLRNTTAIIHDTLLQNDLATYTAPLGLPVSYSEQDSDPALIWLVDTTMISTNVAGCDSIIPYTLHVYRNYHSTDSVFICASRLPYQWEGVTFYGDSTATVTLSTIHGADSLATRVVTVFPIYDVTDTIIICPYRPYLYEDLDYGGAGTYNVPHVTIDGCDSLVRVTLMPRDTNFRLTPEVMLGQDPWMPYDTILLGCVPSILQLHDTSESVSREWEFYYIEDTITDNDTLFSVRADTSGIFGFQLIALSPEGCYDTVRNDSLLWVFPNPQASFSYYPEPVPMHQPETEFFNASLPDTSTYLWLISRDPESLGIDTSYENSPAYQWEEGSPHGEYPVWLIAYLLHHGPDTLTITCTDTLMIPVIIANTFLEFPNLVSPNGDGVNDIWKVVNLLEMREYTMNELWIYDRTGQIVYHVRNIATESQFWDPNATRSPDGTYYFHFTARTYNGVVKRNGLIEVVR